MDARASDGGVDLGPRVRVFCVLFQLFPFKARNISRPQNNAIQQLKSHDPGETIQHTTYICVEGQPRNTRPSRTRVHTSPRARTPRTMSLRVPLAGRSRDARARPSLRRVMTRPRCDGQVTYNQHISHRTTESKTHQFTQDIGHLTTARPSHLQGSDGPRARICAGPPPLLHAVLDHCTNNRNARITHTTRLRQANNRNARIAHTTRLRDTNLMRAIEDHNRERDT